MNSSADKYDIVVLVTEAMDKELYINYVVIYYTILQLIIFMHFKIYIATMSLKEPSELYYTDWLTNIFCLFVFSCVFFFCVLDCDAV